ncbi:IS21-like element helper ATPase IstB [Parapedobacter sp. GCM10030251]|uniref:IS21-like element helper ATPase IstB n=1 Tax=Parapedobacter sp. GCM10030251 TaxID=3273419 RepID=UPI003617B762
MNNEATLQQLKELKLRGMAAAYAGQLELPVDRQLEAHELMAHLTQSEALNRKSERAATYLRMAGLRLPAQPESVICSQERNLGKQQLATLLEGTYIRQAQPVLISGPAGAGKSHLACALGYQACSQGYKTLYMNMNKLIEKITMAKLEGTYLNLLAKMERIPLIILDDFGLQVMPTEVKLALLQIMEDRYERKSIIVASQMPVGSYHDYLNDPAVADAFLDRLTANAHRIELKGDSLRGKKL